ncbi:MAG: zf-HC2 domain-containing protein [Planctomycetes bacterium]|nr:zf-HC2 domain-containing protein [Planctomycetota bacterium]
MKDASLGSSVDSSALGSAGGFDCAAARAVLHAFLERELDPIRVRLLQEHLEACAACRDDEEDLKLERILVLEASVSAPRLSDSFTGKVLAKVEKAVRLAERSRRRRRLLRLGGMAAALLIAAGAVLWSVARREHAGRPPLAAAPAGASTVVEGNPPAAHPPAAAPGAPESALEAVPSAPRVRPPPPVAPRRGDPLPAYEIRARRTPAPVTFASFGEVLGMFERLDAEGIDPRAWQPERARPDDPCRPDPNRDGKMDPSDVAYSCQVLLSSPPPCSLEAAEAGSEPKTDCDEHCLRA